MVEITPLPKAPDIILGIINLQGRIIPVVNVRRRFGLPEKEADINDQMIIAKTSKRFVALVADSVTGVMERPAGGIIEAGQILPGIGYIDGVVKTDDGIVLIHDIEKFLSLEEGESLDKALGKGPGDNIG